jgi:hypothetical protein
MAASLRSPINTGHLRGGHLSKSSLVLPFRIRYLTVNLFTLL